MIVNYPRMRRRAAWPNDLNTALQFSSPNPFSISAPKKWDGKLEYTNGSGWKTWDGGEITSGENGSNHCIYLRGTGNSKITGGYFSSAKWSIVGTNIACNGDIDLLLDYSTVKNGNRPSMASACYSSMFSGCTSLTTAPSLPATTLKDYCYYYMFQNCTSLTAAPSLPATMLTDLCYSYMFSGCKKIKLSTTASGTYTKSYRIPKSGTGRKFSSSLKNMFANTGGTFAGTPEINTTYYLDESNTIV